MKAIDKIYFLLVSSSWFYQLPNKKVIKLEFFYIWMSVAGFFGGIGLGNDAANNLEFSGFYYTMLSMYLFGWLLGLTAALGYTSDKRVRDYFWETQLMRFLDTRYRRHFDSYPNAEERLRKLKTMWQVKYGVSVDWTRSNSPFWHKIQIVLLLGLTGVGILIGYYL